MENAEEENGIRCYLYINVDEIANITQFSFYEDLQAVRSINITDSDLKVYLRKLF